MDEGKNTLLWILIAAVVLLFLFGGSGMGGYGMMGFGMGFGPLFMVIFWGAIIWLVVVIVNSQSNRNDSQDSLTILKKRYAKGEITKKQYEKMKKELG